MVCDAATARAVEATEVGKSMFEAPPRGMENSGAHARGTDRVIIPWPDFNHLKGRWLKSGQGYYHWAGFQPAPGKMVEMRTGVFSWPELSLGRITIIVRGDG
jgi:hypothetical protein